MRYWRKPRERIGARLAAGRWSNVKFCPRRRFKLRPLKWTIAGSCCRGGMRWAGLLRRSSAIFDGLQSGLRIETYRLCEVCLTLVEGPEFIDVEFESAGDVERVEGAYADCCGESLSKSDNLVPGSFGELHGLQKIGAAVSFEVRPRASGIHF